MCEYEIRRLHPHDAAAFCALRRVGLEETPTAFGASPDEDLTRDLERTRARLDPSNEDAVFGAFAAEALVGVVGLHRQGNRKGRHHANVWGMYVAEAHRRQGVGRALIEALVAHARQCPELVWLQLGVDTANRAAYALYEGQGFVRWGVLIDSLRVGGVSVDEAHMALRLDRTAP